MTYGVCHRHLGLLIAVVATARLFAGRTEIEGAQFALEFTDGRLVRQAELLGLGEQSDEARQLILRDGSITVKIRHKQADSAGYRRTFFEITNSGRSELPLSKFVVVDIPTPEGARVMGDCSGSPVVVGDSFLGVEHPLAENQIVNGRLRCALPMMQALRAGETVEVSFVFGTAPEPSQVRRTFLAYVEGERPRPSAPFLHHNTWYNLGYSNPFSEGDELTLIARLGQELVEERKVKLDGFVLDDGWDDTRTLWRFNSGWPEGLRNMTAAAARFGAAPGLWLSPWGGYNRAKEERLAAAVPQGFEVRDGSFSLAGPRYYARFRELCASVVRNDGVAFFKFDGIGAPAGGSIDPAAGRDFDAMLRLVRELRQLRSRLYISQTTGTWPSPWWLLHVDNIWRGGHDHDFSGVGSDRQQWITYRDAQTFSNIVCRGPLFPLNSLMIHGIIFAKRATRLDTDPDNAFENEVRSFFGSGTQVQELYLSPELLNARNWDDLASAARWARANANILHDTHWIGGDPAKREPYGWAAWSPVKGIITLRNPSDHSTAFTFEAGAAFELPTGAAKRFRVASAYPDSPAPFAELCAGVPISITMQPFEVLVLEATPTGP
jgi:hypothetical protein